MMDIQDRNYCPNLQEIDEYIKNPVFKQFCLEIKTKYKCNEKIEYSSCSYEKGWNIKFKKAGILNLKRLVKHYVLSILEKIILLLWL